MLYKLDMNNEVYVTLKRDVNLRSDFGGKALF